MEKTKYLYIRSGDHRYIPIWVVIVDGRVVVRSWNDKPSGWYRAFISQPLGHVRIAEHELSVRAVRVRGARLNDATDEEFAAKYTTKAQCKVCEGLQEPEAQGHNSGTGAGIASPARHLLTALHPKK